MEPDKQTILLVEDEALIAVDRKMLLESHGYSVLHVLHGEDAMETVSRADVELILMDIDLGPGRMSGPEAAEEILRHREIPIIFYTGHAEKETIDKVKGITRYGYVLKDSGEFVLLEAIQMAFELFDAHQADAIRAGEDRYRSLLDAVPDMMFVLDEGGTYVDYKPDAAALLKVPPEKFIGKSVYEMLAPPIAEQIMHYVAVTLSTKQVQQFEHDMMLDGTLYHFETRMAPADDHQVVSIVRDITERKKLEEQARESEHRYRFLFQNTLVSIWEEDFSEVWKEITRLKESGITDIEEYLDTYPETVQRMAGMIRVVDVNEITLKWYGAASKDEMLSNVDQFVTAESASIIRQEIIAIADGKSTVEGESKGKTIDGRILDVYIRISLPPPGEQPKRMIVAINDITELKKVIRQKETLMGELSHRVKNNLMMVSSLIRLKEHALEGRVDLSDLRHQIQAIMMIYQDLYRFESPGLVEVKSYMSRIVQMVTTFSDRAFATDMNIEVDYLPSKSIVPLGLIVNEFMTNALKHGFAEKMDAACSIELRTDADAGQYILRVSDNGNPFPEGIDIEHPQTTGLQLITALAGQLEGTIDLKRAPHPVFTVRFPMENCCSVE